MKPKKRVAKVRSKRPKMPKFYPIDDEMKELSAMLETEVSDWPGISKKPMPPHRSIGFSLLFWSGTTGVPGGGERIVEARYHAQYSNQVNEHADKCAQLKMGICSRENHSEYKDDLS
ncbi:MAG: hypothetical protein JWN63_3333, partial [Candidatus Acidoferrum typicum]|nr:hypothetical protein [Candidatus Acidoferrum typicum]